LLRLMNAHFEAVYPPGVRAVRALNRKQTIVLALYDRVTFARPLCQLRTIPVWRYDHAGR
jgi:hypothetical protein